MELTVDFETGIIEQIRSDQTFTNILLDELEELLSKSEREPAQGMLRVLIAGTVGFDALANSLSMTNLALQQLLTQKTPPHTASLKAITKALKLALRVTAS
jgi:DNA-binding phage protein